MLMNYFEVFLVVGVVVCALVGFLGPVVWLKPVVVEGETSTPIKPFKGWREFFWMLLAVLCLRTFVVEPFKVPSGSMVPTLLIGDYLIVNKHAYGLKMPVNNRTIWQGPHPKRGDIVVFTPPHTGREFWVKRVIGEPGDTIQYSNDQLFVNGKAMPHTFVSTYSDPNTPWHNDTQENENLNGVAHRILQHPEGNDIRSYGEWTVPKGQYFVMGDNRNNSLDSRYWGTVPEQNIRGRVDRIFLNSEKGSDFRWWTSPKGN